MIRLSRAQMDVLAQEAEAAYPNECCGILVGRKDGGDWLTEDIVPSANLSKDPATGFEVDTALRLRLQKKLRGTANSVIGHYHSHPDVPAVPSERDRERAFEVGMVWVIAAVDGGAIGDVHAYLFEGDEAGYSALALDIEG